MSAITLQNIKHLTRELIDEIITFRRWLHQHPELSFEEQNTAKYIASVLGQNSINFREGIAGTGIIASIKGEAGEGRTLALRADIDALPIQENSGLAFSSKNDGVMHACGHDAHTASLLGTGIMLNKLKKSWGGTILLIFQPGEEKHPGGASILLQEGALENPRPDYIIGQHVLPEMESGKLGFRKGICMASADEIYITIKGKGGHAAIPHTLNDTVLASAQLIVGLQQVVSRIAPATIPIVLSFGKIEAKGATNIIPEKVEIAGTLRAMDEKWRAIIKEKIKDITVTTALTYGCSAEIDIKDGYPMVLNNDELTEKVRELAAQYVGRDNVEEMELRMTAEDFGFYTHRFPATFYRFGVKQPNVNTGSLHSPQFNLNEDSLETSAGAMTWIAINLLSD